MTAAALRSSSFPLVKYPRQLRIIRGGEGVALLGIAGSSERVEGTKRIAAFHQVTAAGKSDT